MPSSSLMPLMLRLAAVGLAYGGGAQLAYTLHAHAGSLAVFWPPAGILLGALLATDRRQWWAPLLAAAVANLLMDHLHGQPLTQGLGFLAVNVGAPLLAALVIALACGPAFSFERLRHLTVWCLTVIFVSTPLGAAFGAATMAKEGGYLDKWFSWWAGDLLGCLALTPMVYKLLGPWRWPGMLRAMEAAALLVTLGLATWVVFDPPKSFPLPAAMLYLFLMWAALRFSVPSVSATVTVLSVIALFLTASGIGPYNFQRAMETRMLMMQVYCATGALLFYVLAAVTAERRAAEAEVRASNTRLEQQVEERTAELVTAKDAAEAASRAKDNFIATLSHELRNPLMPVLLVAEEMLENPAVTGEMREAWQTVQQNVMHEKVLIDDMLDLERISRGKLALRPQEVDAHDVLRQALDAVRSGIEEKGLRVTQDFAARNSRLSADAVRLRQVFLNVLGNAVKFTPAGGSLALATRNPAAGGLAVEIIDSGMGLTAEEVARLFQPFAQGDHGANGGSHVFGGLGLGLAITRSLVAMHNGTIHARSEGRGRGAAFTIELPLLESATSPTKADGVSWAQDGLSAQTPLAGFMQRL